MHAQKTSRTLHAEETTTSFFAALQHPPREYRPIAFWFLNHRLEDCELQRQLREMAEQGLGGVMLHARDGLRTGYLQEDWAHAVEVCIAEAEELSLEVWLYDENHYPSGPAGDLLQRRYPDRTMKSLAMVREQYAKAGDPVDFCLPEGTFSMKIGWGTRLWDEEIPLPPNLRILAAGLSSGTTIDLTDACDGTHVRAPAPFEEEAYYLCVLAEVPFFPTTNYQYVYYPDCYDEELTEQFLDLTHRWYAARFGAHFGKTIKGIFGDNNSPNFGYLRRSVPWGKNFAERFQRATGRDIFTVIPGVFCKELPQAQENRLIYWRFMGQAYLESYYGRITQYCTSVGLLSTGHLCLEDGMAEHVKQIGDYFEVMRAFTLTAVDQLGPGEKGGSLVSRLTDGEHLTGCIKNTASAALFQGSPRVMCESFGCASGYWKLDLAEIQRIGSWLFGLGADLFVPHGMYYSIAAHRKWECTPDHLHNTIWKHYRLCTDYLARLSVAGAGGVPQSQIGVLYPIHALRAGLNTGTPAEPTPETARAGQQTHPGWFCDAASREYPGHWDHGSEAEAIQRTFRWTLNALLAEHWDYEIVDETTLTGAAVDAEGLTLSLPGKEDSLCLKVLVLPALTVLEESTHALLEAFVRAGGTVIALNALPAHIFNARSGSLREEQGIFRTLYNVLGSKEQPAAMCSIAGQMKIGQGTLTALACELTADNLCYAELSNVVAAAIRRELELASAQTFITRCWRKNGSRFFYVANGEAKAARAKLRIFTDETLTRIDCQTGRFYPFSNAVQNGIEYAFEPGEALLLVAGPIPIAPEEPPVIPGIESTQHHRTLPENWAIHADRQNTLVMRRWQCDMADKHRIVSYSFRADFVPSRLTLLLDLERSVPELDSHRFAGRVVCRINGKTVPAFSDGVSLDRHIYEADISGMVVSGTNVLQLELECHLSIWESALHPLMLLGDFSVASIDGQDVLHPPARELRLGDWAEQGFLNYAGTITYTQTVTLPPLQAGTRLLLDAGELADMAEFRVNGTTVCTRIAPPWIADLSAYAGAEVLLEIAVTNSPENLFSQNKVPTGLFGPVTLQVRRLPPPDEPFPQYPIHVL